MIPNKKKTVQKPTPKKMVPALRGKGNYDLVPRALGAAAGAVFPGSGPLVTKGAQLVANGLPYLKSMIRKIRGKGDYEIGDVKPAYNVVFNTDQIPRFDAGSRGFTVCHREYVGQVKSSPTPLAFDLAEYRINPLSRGAFPWLCKVGANYNKYRVHGMVFEYVSNSGPISGSTNTALGNVAMAVTPNPAEPPPRNKVALEMYEGVVSSSPCNSIMCAAECDPKTRQFGTMQVASAFEASGDASTPPKQARSALNPFMTDWGKLWVATTGIQGADVQLGELWVSYCVEFYEQRMDLNSCNREGWGEFTAIGASWSTATTTFMRTAGGIFLDKNGGANQIRAYLPAASAGSVFQVSFSASGAFATPTLAVTSDLEFVRLSNQAVNSYVTTDGATRVTGTCFVTLNNPLTNIGYVGINTGNPAAGNIISVWVSEVNTALWETLP